MPCHIMLYCHIVLSYYISYYRIILYRTIILYYIKLQALHYMSNKIVLSHLFKILPIEFQLTFELNVLIW